jgi:general secretion pathway protein I
MSNNEYRKETAGFTLLEVLVALALLGMAVTVVLQLFSANLRSISASEEYVAGSLEAQAKMREVLEEKDISEGTRNGITDNGYRFQVFVSDNLTERSESLPVKLMEVEVKVYWTQGNKDKSLTLKTLKMVEKEV